MLNNLSIKARLVAALTILATFTIVTGISGIFSLAESNRSLRAVYEERLLALGELDSAIRAILVNQVIIAEAASGDAARLPAILAPVEKNRAEFNRQWKAYSSAVRTPAEQTLAAEFATARAAYVRQALDPMLAAARNGDGEQVKALLSGPMHATFGPLRAKFDALVAWQAAEGKQEFEASQREYAAFRRVVIGLLVLGVLLAAGVGYWLVRSITLPLGRAVRIAEKVADGDLTQLIEVHSADETGKVLAALRDMNDSLAGIVGKVRQSSDTIATASSQIAVGNLDLSSRTEQQASSLLQTASSMEELTGTVQQNADNARQANLLAASASEVAVRGGAVVGQVVAKMGVINDSAHKIVEIIAVIDGIAFQTNILALNAAVEAARAGEQGRGFAVVATEVRNLAQRAAAAAREIKDLIDSSVGEIKEGSRLADDAGATMQEVVSSVRRVSDIIGEISCASAEQSTGISQVNQAVGEMDSATQQNSALVEQAAAAAGALQDQASSLAHAVGVFRLPPQRRTPAPRQVAGLRLEAA
ncbi:HAMP domain-containing protein [Pseudoduganella sp. DS3]|uniref:HAMP domain-containing protein n=2 Tax=Pseudoduganella guangdongensis TaxID=2692179 RepID=A0A6N9HQ42_9BURK|nr:HAMP domain-containing protein [Pseudoduganella guangdongensis]